MKEPRMTAPTLRVLGLLTSCPELSGRIIGEALQLSSGTLYPILARLEASQWVASRWEDGDPAALGRPRRRFYQLTDQGRAKARTAVSEVLAAWP